MEYVFKQYKPDPYDCMVKGKAYRKQFLAGAGGFEFEIIDYSMCSISWVLQMDWVELKIKPLP
jgi:hypothetical protein